jgi:hypothetical protein
VGRPGRRGRAFPPVRPVLGAVRGLDTGLFEELPNEFAAFGAVVIQGLVGPLPRDQDTTASDAQVFGPVRLVLAVARSHGMSDAFGLNAVEQPHRTPRRARGDLQFGVQPSGVVAVGVGGVLTESSGLPDAFGQIFCEVSDVATGLFGAPQNSLDVHLSTELDNVCGFDQFLTSLVPARQRRPSVEISKGFRAGVPHWQSFSAIEELVMGWPPHLVVSRGGDGPQLGTGNGSADGGVEVRGAAFLGLDRAEVLHVPADAAAGVLPEPIHQRREVDGVARSPPVVIPLGIGRCPFVVYAPVGVIPEAAKFGKAGLWLL